MTKQVRNTKSKSVAQSQDAINELLSNAAREDKRAGCDRFPALDDLVAQGAQLAPAVPKWKQRRIDFCKHYDVDVSRISVQQNGDLVAAFKAWCAAQDRLEAAAMS